MKLKLLLLTFILVCTGCKNDPRIQAAYDLIERVTPGYGEQFKLELMEPIDGMDAYEITSDNGKVVLRGNNTISLATAFNQYLKYTCNAHVSWFGNQLDLPKQLPMPAPVKNTINGKYRVYMNYCTVSYSAAWWDWERWQRELDFMAMNSINMPLSVVGLEAVWYNTLLKHKFTDEEARQFLAGPGHFAWQWMQNLQSYGGPLPKSWIDKHIVLGKQIIDRELELGMQPIQQGFSGYVPRELKEKYPDAKIQLQPYSWDSLKRALASKTVKIETPSDETCFTTISLDPCPIPLDIKVILTGDEELYEMLTERDPDFCDYFKVEADFGVLMDRTFENEVEYAKLIGSLSKKKKIRSLNKQAVAKVIEYSSRLAEDSEKLTAHIASIGDLLREADFWARKSKANQIGKNHIEQAISEQIYRSDRIKQAMLEQIDKGTILIDVEGAKVGQINGLVVYNFSRNSFGKPSRITTQVRMGKGEFIDIEREIQMSGPIHTKGVLILSSLIANRFAKESPLSLSASIVFEQSYGGVDGDSASSTEYYCLLSAISNIPIKQNIAVTGSINQFGEIQPIGGANEKIEGFFDVCKHRGLTGDQGVIIPRTNVSSLMLREDVLQAVEEGQFHIWAVDTVDDGIEILTGMPAGKPNKNGEYPKGTVNYAVQKGLEHYYKCYVRYARETHGCLGK